MGTQGFDRSFWFKYRKQRCFALKKKYTNLSVKNNLNAFADGVKNFVASFSGGLQLNYAYA
jgi:hypothetical protein